MNSWEKPIFDEHDFDVWKVAGVELTCSQIEDPHKELSTQQTTDYLKQFDYDEDYSFPKLTDDICGLLTQVDTLVEAASQTLGTDDSATCSQSIATTSRSPTIPTGSPKRESYVLRIQKSSIPVKTRNNTNWAVKLWTDWAISRNKNLLPGEQPFITLFSDLTLTEMNFWLSRFVLEIRKKNSEPYPPNTLYQVVSGLQRFLREHGRADIKIFENPALHGFKATIDGEMKRLNKTGKYVNKKQAQPIAVEQEDRLWELGLLGDHSPHVLLNTIIYQVGLFFALRSGSEHRRLRHSPSQIELVEPPGGRAYLIYREDISKTNQGGLSSRKRKPKVVRQYANEENPQRCFVRLFKLYTSRCPKDRPDDALYLTPLRSPKGDIWYSKTPLGHNMLAKTVRTMMEDAGYEGHYTNHSARVTCASRLFDAQIDEQLIMARTNHASTDGVRAYKRASTKLQELTSDILNSKQSTPGPSVKHQSSEPDTTGSLVKRKCSGEGTLGPSVKRKCYEQENKIPSICISGGTNITININ